MDMTSKAVVETYISGMTAVNKEFSSLCIIAYQENIIFSGFQADPELRCILKRDFSLDFKPGCFNGLDDGGPALLEKRRCRKTGYVQHANSRVR